MQSNLDPHSAKFRINAVAMQRPEFIAFKIKPTDSHFI
jgi:hypothetical protein